MGPAPAQANLTAKPWRASCQYERPYVDSLQFWEDMGATCYHPGDYTGQEFLNELQTFTGQWVYMGHAFEDRLRGYGHLLTADLLAHKPARPLNGTLFLTCNTLGEAEQGLPLALEWHLAGASRFTLAATGPVNTAENQQLAIRMLHALESNHDQPLWEFIRQCFAKPTIGGKNSGRTGELYNIAAHYRLLGDPWAIVPPVLNRLSVYSHGQ
ncbi:MAG: hypothetical protein HC848_07995 [Limnobacter sp.]|nr:hypothetical protein [Limnobacter sp.]